MPALNLLFAGLLLSAVPSGPPDEATALKTLRKEHPRLLALQADVQRVKKLIASDAAAAALYQSVKRSAEKTLREAPVEHKLVGPRLLDQSRKCLNRVFTCATVYRLEGDRRFLDRAVKEMEAAAAFKDWNPSHFLDTAEMTAALGIGYDWLYADLTSAQRSAIRRAIIEKGLRQGEQIYRKGSWWAKCRHNWNQVCNGGLTVGALAVADEEPQLAGYIVAAAVRSVPLAMGEFAPDGGWNEGPGYWSYATSYNVYMLAALDSALGNDFGLSRTPGFAQTGDFRMHATAPTLLNMNFADCGERAGHAWQMHWLARKFRQPLYAWHEREVAKGSSAQDLWWFDPTPADPKDFPLDRWFRQTDVAMLRSSWTDPKAVWAALKGGDNKANHSHLELGAFWLDADGQRWAVDLGGDDYNLPGYFGKQRWTYYRLATVGQNTLTIGGQSQDPKAVAPIVAFASAPARAHAVTDLSAAYAGQAKSVCRGVALLDRKLVLVQDEIQSAAGPVVWQMHTRAKVELDGDAATLSQGGAKLKAAILAPVGAKFAAESANPPAPQRQNNDVTKLVVKLPAGKAATMLAILFTPGSAGASEPPKLTRLADWKASPSRPASTPSRTAPRRVSSTTPSRRTP